MIKKSLRRNNFNYKKMKLKIKEESYYNKKKMMMIKNKNIQYQSLKQERCLNIVMMDYIKNLFRIKQMKEKIENWN